MSHPCLLRAGLRSIGKIHGEEALNVWEHNVFQERLESRWTPPEAARVEAGEAARFDALEADASRGGVRDTLLAPWEQGDAPETLERCHKLAQCRRGKTEMAYPDGEGGGRRRRRLRLRPTRPKP